MSLRETELQTKIVEALEAECGQLDTLICRRLQQSRQQAVVATEQPFWLRGLANSREHWLTAGMTATFVFVVSLMVFSPETTQDAFVNATAQPSTSANIEKVALLPKEPIEVSTVNTIGKDFDALLNEEDLDFFENMELYQWLDAEFG
jgi:uncharacterized protein (DUF1697 family)